MNDIYQVWETNKKNGFVWFNDVKDLNLCDLYLTVNTPKLQIVKIDGSMTLDPSKPKYKAFTITEPTTITVSQLTPPQFKKLEPIMVEARHSYSIYKRPPYYLKGQGNKWLYDVSTDVGHGGGVEIKLLDWQFSYATITVNGIECSVSHGAGTGYKIKGFDDPMSRDTAHDWSLIGPDGLKAFTNAVKSYKW